MSIRNLDRLFSPRSMAIIGASERPRSVGAAVVHNALAGGFAGRIHLVNPRHRQLAGLPVYPGISALPEAPDLAVICTPPATVPALIAALGERGGRAAIVITAGLGRSSDGGQDLRARMLAAAKPYVLRILGPNCIGLLVPALGLNASFAPTHVLPGTTAFVSQSGAMMTAVLDWARARGIGFSKFVSIGEGSDIDIGDILDYLGSDPDTQSILLYVEAVTAARKFMSAARGAARHPPGRGLQAGRGETGARAAATHSGAMAGADSVYDAAIRRAGMLRVFTTEALFDTVETLARMRALEGDRLAVMTNGGGLGVMAADALTGTAGRLAELSVPTLRALDEALPAEWSHANPVDILGDAPPLRYARTLDVLLQEPCADAVLLLHAPTAIVPSEEIARELLPAARGARRSVLSCWLGGEGVQAARAAFSSAGLPTFETPEAAVAAFERMVQYRRNQQLLMEVPPARTSRPACDRTQAAALIQRAVDERRSTLTEPEAKALLAAYGIPVVPTLVARTVEEAVQRAVQLGFPVALKILSRDITHKSDVGGVVLDLHDADDVRAAAGAMLQGERATLPAASIDGFSVQPMIRRPDAFELIAGAATDPVFGPVILFGQGGTAAEIIADHAVALPPLNAVLARDLVDRTRVSRLLRGYRGRGPVDVEAVVGVLVQLSVLLADLPAVGELDINPLLVDEAGALALDARVGVAFDVAPAGERFAIRPYPEQLEESVEWAGRRLLLRPIRPEDGPQHLAFFHALTPEDVHLRTFALLSDLPASQLARLTQIDYDREMAFVATVQDEGGKWETLGVARAIADPDNEKAEFGLIVRSDVHGRGLGNLLLGKLIDYCRKRGTGQLVSETLVDNHGMIALARKWGFTLLPYRDRATYRLRLALRHQASEPARPADAVARHA
jgi:acetyltransferase